MGFFLQAPLRLIIVGGAIILLLAGGIFYYITQIQSPSQQVDKSGGAPAPFSAPPSLFPRGVAPQAQTEIPTGIVPVSSTAVREVSFAAAYPVTWEESGIKFFLTGVLIGKIKAPAYPYYSPNPYQPRPPSYLKKSSGGTYLVGEEVHALVLKLKITFPVISGRNSIACPSFSVRRVVNEEGDMVAPNHSQFFLESGGCQGTPGVTYFDQPVIFIVPEGEKDFLFTTGGQSNVFFNIALKNDTIIVENLGRREPPKSIPPSITLQEPISTTTIKRGESLSLRWSTSGDIQARQVSFRITSVPPYSFTQTQSYTASQGKGFLRVEVPPGKYTLEILPPFSTKNPKIALDVTGTPPTISTSNSILEFASGGDTGEIIADGVCNEEVFIAIVDEFDYGLPNKKVELKSSRGEQDFILAKSSLTDTNGEIGFVVASKTPGIAKLTATVEGMELPKALILKILDPATGTCPF